MAVQFIGTTSGSAINGGNVAITYPGPFKSSDVAIVTVSICTSLAATLAVVSSSGGALYTQIVTTIRTSNLSFGVFRRVIASTAEQAISITGGAARALTSVTGVVHIFRGVDTTTPEDVAATSTNGGSTSADPPSITPASFGCGIVASMGRGTSISATLTGPSGFLNFQSTTANDTDPATVGQAWIGNGSTSPADPGVFASSVTGTWCSATVALRPLALTSAAGDPWRSMGENSADYLVREALKTVVRSY
jgi:hypothetical protein